MKQYEFKLEFNPKKFSTLRNFCALCLALPLAIEVVLYEYVNILFDFWVSLYEWIPWQIRELFVIVLCLWLIILHTILSVYRLQIFLKNYRMDKRNRLMKESIENFDFKN